MELIANWKDIKSLFNRSFHSSFHFAIATVTENGDPHATPIGSLILGKPGRGFYFEKKFTKHLPLNFEHNKKVCVLAVNSSRWFWLKSLIVGRFASPPALRLHGVAGPLREATEAEAALFQKRVKRVRFSRGHALMWRNMRMVRDIAFTGIEPVHMEMTRQTGRSK